MSGRKPYLTEIGVTAFFLAENGGWRSTHPSRIAVSPEWRFLFRLTSAWLTWEWMGNQTYGVLPAIMLFSWKFVLSFEASFRKWKGFIAFSLFLWEKYRIKAYSKIQKFIGFRMVYRIKYILPAVGRTDPKHSFASPDKSWILTKAELRLSSLRRQH